MAQQPPSAAAPAPAQPEGDGLPADPEILAGQVAVVTGAGRGLGRAAAVALAGAGARVALLARKAAELDEVAGVLAARHGEARALALPTDVTDEGAVAAAAAAVLRRWGRVDALVNNAGVAVVAPLLQMDLGDLRRLLEVNVIGAVACARAFGAPMVQQGYGRIINIASIAGLIGEPALSAYATSKGALLSFTRALAVEWARHGVTVNAIAPGYFRTDMNAAALDDPEIAARMLRHIPLRRVGQPEELGPLVVYLASTASAFMTGATLVIDGGQAAR